MRPTTLRASRQTLSTAVRILLSYAAANGYIANPCGNGVTLLLDSGEWKTVYSTDAILAVAERESRAA